MDKVIQASEPVKRPKTLAELNAEGIIPRLVNRKRRIQAFIQKAQYRPCECGSGRKAKFCCHSTKQPKDWGIE